MSRRKSVRMFAEPFTADEVFEANAALTAEHHNEYERRSRVVDGGELLTKCNITAGYFHSIAQ